MSLSVYSGYSNDLAWRRAVWGQFGVVALGTGLIIAAANDRLIAMLAHDRAGFGGSLIANGVANVLIGLWGIRRGAAWVWWTLLIAGSIGFSAAIGIHFVVGHLDVVHLFPGFIALALFVFNQGALRHYLLDRPFTSVPKAGRLAAQVSRS